MAYTTFTAAWTAWKAMYPSYKTSIDNCTNYLALLITQTTITGVRNAAYAAISALSLALVCHADYQAGDAMNSHHYAACYFAWYEGAPVTMAAIISAMLTAKFDELQYFIGIEDAYRCALWNAPFNADFYAALARGFMKWP